MTTIFVVDEKTGEVERKCSYSVDPEKAIVNYIMQYIKNNWNTWQYPKYIEGVRQSINAPGHYYYDDVPNGKIICAYPDK